MAPMAPTDEETLYVMKMATLDGAEGLEGNPDEAVSFECTISAAQVRGEWSPVALGSFYVHI